MKEVDFDSMTQAEAEEFVELWEANLEAMDAIDEEIEPLREELSALYDERRNVRGVAVSAIVRGAL